MGDVVTCRGVEPCWRERHAAHGEPEREGGIVNGTTLIGLRCPCGAVHFVIVSPVR